MPSAQTHFSRRPRKRAVGNIRSLLSLLYPMAELSLWKDVYLARAATRAVFGRRQPTGLSIS